MRIKEGQLCLTKKEKDEFEVLIQHIQTDLSWGENGSYGDGSKLYTKEFNQSGRALHNLKTILRVLAQ